MFTLFFVALLLVGTGTVPSIQTTQANQDHSTLGTALEQLGVALEGHDEKCDQVALELVGRQAANRSELKARLALKPGSERALNKADFDEAIGKLEASWTDYEKGLAWPRIATSTEGSDPDWYRSLRVKWQESKNQVGTAYERAIARAAADRKPALQEDLESDQRVFLGTFDCTPWISIKGKVKFPQESWISSPDGKQLASPDAGKGGASNPVEFDRTYLTSQYRVKVELECSPDVEGCVMSLVGANGQLMAFRIDGNKLRSRPQTTIDAIVLSNRTLVRVNGDVVSESRIDEEARLTFVSGVRGVPSQIRLRFGNKTSRVSVTRVDERTIGLAPIAMEVLLQQLDKALLDHEQHCVAIADRLAQGLTDDLADLEVRSGPSMKGERALSPLAAERAAAGLRQSWDAYKRGGDWPSLYPTLIDPDPDWIKNAKLAWHGSKSRVIGAYKSAIERAAADGNIVLSDQLKSDQMVFAALLDYTPWIPLISGHVVCRQEPWVRGVTGDYSPPERGKGGATNPIEFERSVMSSQYQVKIELNGSSKLGDCTMSLVDSRGRSIEVRIGEDKLQRQHATIEAMVLKNRTTIKVNGVLWKEYRSDEAADSTVADEVSKSISTIGLQFGSATANVQIRSIDERALGTKK